MRNARRPAVVVVTGASAGLGRAIARRFAQQGAQLGLIARGADGLRGARQEVERLGGEAIALPVDVADAEQVDQAATAIEERFGPIDLWINNAMVSVFAPFLAVTPEEFKRVTEVTYLGYVYGTMSALSRMVPRDRGVIVQVGSALAYRAIPLQSAYCGAKHAIEGFSESVRTELLHVGSRVHITSVHMPALNTPQFGWSRAKLPKDPQPVPPIYQPEVGAEAVYFAAYARRREVRCGFSTNVVIAGNKLAPALGDWYLAKTGYQAQMTDRPVAADRRDNLFEPVPGDHGAHGPFDRQAKRTSWQLWATKHRGLLASAAALLGAGLVTASALRRQR